jgi:drug/metabolite transporter (DMT)-like permease
MAHPSPGRLTLLAFAAMVLIGGTNFVAVRFSNRELPPFWGASLRFVAAALVLFAITAARKLPLPRGRALLGTVIYGLLGFGAFYALAYWALRHVPAGLAAVVLASTPLLTFLLALLHGQEQFRWRALIGGAIALIGIGVIFRGSVGADVPLSSLLAMLVGALCVAESSVVVKNFPKTHPVSTNAVAMATGVAVLVTLSLLLEEPWRVPVRASTWIALSYLILLGSSAAFVLFLFILGRWTASAASYQFVLFPIVAIIVAALLEHAPVSPSLLFGGGLVLASVYAGVISQPSPSDTRPKLGSEPCLTCPE